MSFVIATPEMLTTAATDLAKIGSTITAANTAAAAVAKVLPASADEVSVAVAALFGTHAQEYQTVSAQVATFHDRFVQTLSAAASSYVAAEAVNVEQSLLAAVNAPTQALFGRPLIGNGADGSPGTGQAGGPPRDAPYCCGAGFNTLKIAPCGSDNTANRPTDGMSAGSAMTWPPAAAALAAVASASSTAK